MLTTRTLALLTLPLGLALAGCGGSTGSTGSAGSTVSTSPSAAPSSAAAPAGGGAAVTYTVAQYKLPALTVAPGAKVKVVDGDGEPHTVTADDGSFDTGSFDKSAPGTFTAPAKPGTYKIHCSVHPSMHGTITVR